MNLVGMLGNNNSLLSEAGEFKNIHKRKCQHKFSSVAPVEIVFRSLNEAFTRQWGKEMTMLYKKNSLTPVSSANSMS